MTSPRNNPQPQRTSFASYSIYEKPANIKRGKRSFRPELLLATFLGLIVCACGQAVQPPGIQISTPPPAQLLTSTAALAAGYPVQGDAPLEIGYPPQATPVFDAQPAYPAPALTAALPTLTVTVRAPTYTIPPTVGPLINPLPAPVYYIPSRSGMDRPPDQIWRMEPDGVTLRQVTNEEQGIDYRFDVAADGRLAYVSSNNLIVTDGNGGNRKVIVAGMQPPPLQEEGQWFSNKEKILSPAWSQDGKKIAYQLDGVNLIDLSSGQTINLLAGPSWTANPLGTQVPEEDRYAYHYYPIDWTPDGSRIVLQGIGYESFSTAFVKPIQNAVLEPVDIFAAGCCDYSFTQDGQMLFSSGDHIEIGLWLVDAQTGRAENLTGGKQYHYGRGPVIISPRQAPDGRIFFFTTRSGDGMDEGGKLLAFVNGKKAFLVPEDVTFVGQEPVREGVLWLPDASGVIVLDPNGRLALMETANGTVTPFGVEGYSLRWGVK